jgi:hypothetical protein
MKNTLTGGFISHFAMAISFLNDAKCAIDNVRWKIIEKWYCAMLNAK